MPDRNSRTKHPSPETVGKTKSEFILRGDSEESSKQEAWRSLRAFGKAFPATADADMRIRCLCAEVRRPITCHC